MRRIKTIIVTLALTTVMGAAFGPVSIARAADPAPAPAPASSGCSWWQTAIPFGGALLCLTSKALNASGNDTLSIAGKILAWLLGFIIEFLTWALAMIMAFFSYLVYIRIDNGMPVLKATWTILRDLSNMFFILILIWMAFATIFNVGKHRFQDMIYRLLVVAVLINFSLVIGGLVMDAGQVLVNVLLNMIGDPGNRLGQFLSPSGLLPGIKVENSLMGSIFGIILGAMLLFSMLVATAFALFRIFILWGLLIVSPIAWMAYILPGTRKWWSKWWGTFVGWNIFLPCFLFILYLGLYFLSKENEIMAAISGNRGTGNFMNTSVSFNMFFFYTFTAAFLIYGTAMAAKMTSAFGGDGFEKGVGWARTTVGKLTGYDARRKAYGEAVSERVKQFQTEGFQNKYLNWVYGGKQGDERIKARMAERLGVHDVKQDQLSKDVNIWKDHFKNMNADELRTKMSTGPKYQQLAARELLRGMDQLSNEELVETHQMYGGDRSPAARKFLLDIDYEKMDKRRRQDMYNRTTDLQVKHKIAAVMADKGDYRVTRNIDPDPVTGKIEIDPETEEPRQVTNIGKTRDRIKEDAIALYKTDGDRMDFLKKMHKKNFISAAQAAAEMQRDKQVQTMTDSQGNQIKTYEAAYKKYIGDKVTFSPTKELAELGMEAWGDETFVKAVEEKAKKLQEAKRPKIHGGTTKFGGGDDFRKNLRQAVINSDADPKKLEVINGLKYDYRVDGDTTYSEEEGGLVDEEGNLVEGEEDEESTKENQNRERHQRQQQRSPATPTNPGEKLSRGGIVLSPGAQFDMRKNIDNSEEAAREQNRLERERIIRERGQSTNDSGAGTVSYRNVPGINQANVVDLRNKKDVEIK